MDLGTRVRCSGVVDKLERELGRAVDLYLAALPRVFWHFRVTRSETQWKANYIRRTRHGIPFTWCDFEAVQSAWFAIPSISLVCSRTLSFSLGGIAVIDIHKDRPLQRLILCIKIDSLGLVCSLAKPSPSHSPSYSVKALRGICRGLKIWLQLRPSPQGNIIHYVQPLPRIILS